MLTNNFFKKAAAVQEDHIETESEQQRRFLANFSFVMIITFAFASITSIINFFVDKSSAQLLELPVCLAGVGVAWFCHYCSSQPKTLKLGSWLIIIYTNLIIAMAIYQFGQASPIPAAFFITTLLGAFLLSWQAIVLLTLVNLVYVAGVYTFENSVSTWPLRITIPADGVLFTSITTWALLLLVPAGLALAVLSQLRRTNRMAMLQNEQLTQILNSAEYKRQFGQQVSQKVLSVTNELNSTAIQQKSSSHEQAEALESAIVTLHELAQTASFITKSAEDINQDVSVIATTSQEQQEFTSRVATIAKTGVGEQDAALESSLKVQAVYHQMSEILTDLAQGSGEIKRVIGIMEGISAETHLLALNAAIEAAGAGSYGQRFGIVADEVKALSNRSMKASQEVKAILGQIENGIQQAAEASASGEAETVTSVTAAHIRSENVKKALVAVELSRDEVAKITEAVQRLKQRTTEIYNSTEQQTSASLQAVQRLEQIGVLAQQSAVGSEQLTTTVIDLEQLSRELNTTLAA